MEISPSPSQTGFRTSRRSFPNLQHLSLAPLSSRFPLDSENIDVDYDVSASRSYIQATTAPTTPSILSRSSSQQRRRKKKSSAHAHYAHESYFAPSHDPNALIGKAKSSSALLSPQTRHAAGLATLSPIASRNPSLAKSASQPQPTDEWLHRAGLAIAEESRIAKGQSWLVSRDSSTSLVTQIPLDDDGDDDRDAAFLSLAPLGSGLALADDGGGEGALDDAPATPRWPASISRGGSRPGSRHGAGSRAASRAHSRRGSRASRLDAAGFAMTSASGAPLQPRESGEGYFDSALGAEPDFVDPSEVDDAVAAADSGADEEEVRRLASQKGFGFGGVLDRLVGWTLFNVDEDREESEKEEVGEDGEEARRRREREIQRRRELLESAASSSALATQARESETTLAAGEGEQARGWQDAAWLLSVASKVIL